MLQPSGITWRRTYAAADSKWSKSDESVPVEALANEPFVAFSARSGSFEHASFLCSRAGFLPKVTQHARDGVAILGFVAADVGIAILLDIYEHTGVSGIISRALSTSNATSSVVLAYRRSRYANLVEQFERIAIEERG